MANLRSIVAKLNDTMRGTLDGAAGLCVARTHYDVEIEHFLTKLLDAGGTDFAGIVQHFGDRRLPSAPCSAQRCLRRCPPTIVPSVSFLQTHNQKRKAYRARTRW